MNKRMRQNILRATEQRLKLQLITKIIIIIFFYYIISNAHN